MSTSNKLTYLNETKQELKQKINNLGGSIDEQTTFRQYANQLQNVYDNLPKTEYQEGTEVNLGVTTKGKLDYDNGVVGIGQIEQDGTPTPETPIEIEVVRGNIEIEERGKNFWEFGDYVGNATKLLTFTNPLPKGTYTFSFNVINATGKAIDFYSSDNVKIKNLYIAPHTTITKVTPTFTANIEIAKVTIYSGDSADELTNIQLEEGSTATDYEPYQEPKTYQLSLGDIELCKIDTYRDYLWKNLTNGKWYKHSAIKKLELLGTENWTYYQAGLVFYTDDYASFFNGGTGTNLDIYSNYFIGGYFSETNNSIQIGNTNGRVHVRCDMLTSLADFKTWLGINKPLLYAKLNTPTDTEITNTTLIEQLENWYNAHSNNGTTIITSNGELPMIIKVRALKGE